MKLPRMCFGPVPKFAFMCVRQHNERIHYIPNARHLAKKVLAGLFLLLGAGAVACGILAASICQTLMPCIGLLILGMLLFVFAYCQYVKAWTRLEIPDLHYRKHIVSQLTEKEYFSLLRTFRSVSPGKYCHPCKRNISISEGTVEQLKKNLEKRTVKKSGVFLIQELDLEAIRQKQLETETVYQGVFKLPESMRECVNNSLKTSVSREKIIAVPWINQDQWVTPQEVIYTGIPGLRQESTHGEGAPELLTVYTKAYVAAFTAAITRASVSRTVSREGLCIVVSPLGVVKALEAEEVHAQKILSKIAFLQAVEYMATKAVLPENKAELLINIVLIDPESIAPLRAIGSKALFPQSEYLCFSELSPAKSSWNKVV
ncbi:hypothetical protein [Chlamydia vaughanii]|uniref:hypothetical protein n=1 Tax=Chlamydia vaughanii TaxID=3112552 RepID=UPI0032B11B56